MTTDELRAKFEAWAKSKGSHLTRTLDGDDYWDSWTCAAWVAWQAAHASRDAEIGELREASTNSKINTHKFLYSKGLGNGSLRVCDCFDSTSIECLGLSSDIEFLEKLLSLAKKYEE